MSKFTKLAYKIQARHSKKDDKQQMRLAVGLLQKFVSACARPFLEIGEARPAMRRLQTQPAMSLRINGQ